MCSLAEWHGSSRASAILADLPPLNTPPLVVPSPLTYHRASYVSLSFLRTRPWNKPALSDIASHRQQGSRHSPRHHTHAAPAQPPPLPLCHAQGEPAPAIIKTHSRASVILPDFLKCVFFVHNGTARMTRIEVSEPMVGHKLGEFAPTRKVPKHKRDIKK